MNKNILTLAGILSFFAVNAALGTDIYLTNETQFPAQISVSYTACRPDIRIPVGSRSTIQIPAGACLISQINALIYVPGNAMPASATAYQSSGTGYRTFKLIQNYDGSFAVIRP